MSGDDRDERRLHVDGAGASGAADPTLGDEPTLGHDPTVRHEIEPVLVPDVVHHHPVRPRRPRGLGPTEIGVLVVLAVLLAVIGIVVAALAADDDGSSVVASTSTTARPTTTSSTTTTTAPAIDRGADATLTAQVRGAVDEAEPGTGNVVSGVYLNLLGNMKIDTNLANSRASADRALVICQVGKSLGYTDVEVRGANGKDLASTGLLDNRCRRHR